MFYIVSISVFIIILATYLILAKKFQVSLLSYFFPWMARETVSPVKRLYIAFISSVFCFFLSSVMMFSSVCTSSVKSGTFSIGSIVEKTELALSSKIKKVYGRNIEALAFCHNGQKQASEQVIHDEIPVLKNATDICVVYFVYLTLPLFPLNGGQIILASIELVDRKRLSPKTWQIIGSLSALLLVLLIIL